MTEKKLVWIEEEKNTEWKKKSVDRLYWLSKRPVATVNTSKTEPSPFSCLTSLVAWSRYHIWPVILPVNY